MIVKEYIKEFETLGFGMFVHFGAYSLLGKGEWAKKLHEIPYEEYDKYVNAFEPKKDWAEEVVSIAKNAGCKYVTLTTRHHDGFSLFDTCGLNEYDTVHTCGRDLVKEFVNACHEHDIIPFFYHTLLDWHEPTYTENFPKYLEYLRASIEILCTNYGKIGGLWFDGMWDKPDDDWQEDVLYATIRKHQPNAMIINNTGLSAHGALGHIELDSVTFERGKPQPINMEGAPKYVASEMCEVFCSHWGYAKEDLNYKSPATMIKELVDCRRYGCNMLINVGPLGDGSVRPIDAAILGIMGEWVAYNEESIRKPLPSGIEVANKSEDFILKNGKDYYLFCSNLPMMADPNVALCSEGNFVDEFELDEKIQSAMWLDNGAEVKYAQEGSKVVVTAEPYSYGRDLVVRVAKITVY